MKQIHKYRHGELFIVLDVSSGAVHLVDELAYRLLDYMEGPAEQCPEGAFAALWEYPRAEVEETYGELLEQCRTGQLFSTDDYGPHAERMTLSPVKAMCLNVSHDCNLRCAYCFAGKGDYAGERMVMSAETGKQAIDFLVRESGDRERLEVDFFGGEPLMNFQVVRQVVDYARGEEKRWGKRFRFTITTNGLLLDEEKTGYINREMSNVVLSLDGRKAVNDRVRSRVDGRGCYEDIVPKFQRLVRERGDGEYYVRGTFTGWNKDFADDVLALRDLGFDQVSVEPVVAGPGEPYALTEEDLPELFAEYDRLAELYLRERLRGRGFNFFHFMVDLDQGPCIIKRLRGCGCGNEYLAVTPAGDIYPCHQFIGHEEWRMGSVADGSFDRRRKEYFSKTTVYHKPECRECWARFYCSGGCNANNMRYRGDVLLPHTLSCELEKKRLECAIALKAELALQKEDAAG